MLKRGSRKEPFIFSGRRQEFFQARKESRMNEKCVLDRMARVVSEVQAISLWVDSAGTNYVARNRYRKFKAALQELIKQHKSLAKSYEFLRREE